MFRRAFGTITMKGALAVLLLAFAVMSVGVSMPCLTGMSMEAEKPVAQTDSCCPEQAPQPEKSDCCCIETLGKTIVEFNVGKAVQPSLDFPILLAPEIRIEVPQLEPLIEQPRWPEVHGPPGIVPSTDSPRAPPLA